MLNRTRPLFNLVGDKLRTLPLLVLYLTDGCNSRCVTCDIWRNPRRNMKMSLIDELADTCGELGVRWVLLSGGEAMQHPEWALAARRFREQGVHVMLLTNGLLLRKQIDDVLVSVDEVIVSLDAGTAATYAAIRGVDAFDLVLEGAQAVRVGGLPVTTRTTVQRGNFREIPQIIDAAKSADVNLISFLTVDVSNPFAFGERFQTDTSIPLMGQNTTALLSDEVVELDALLDQVEVDYAGDFASGRIAESPEKLRLMVRYFAFLNGDDSSYPPPRCNAPHFSTVVEVDGRLRPCYFLPEYGKLGDDGSLQEAMNVPAAVALRRAYRTGQRPECAQCVCPLYKGPRSLLRM